MDLRRPLFLFSCTLGAIAAMAQDPQLSQFYAAPMYLNPALTGSTMQDRIGMNYRLQWNGVPPGFRTYAVSYDHNAEKQNSGFGGMVMRDVSGTNRLAFTYAALAYSYTAHIDRHHSVRAGMRLGYTLRDYDQSSLLFADQVIRDNAPSSLEPGLTDRVSYLDASAGCLYYTERFWIGASFNHLNRPQQTLFFTGDVRLPVRTSVHTGYRFPLDHRKLSRSESFMTLASHYKAQDKWDQLDIGGYIEHHNVIGGLWYRGLQGIKAYQPGYQNNESIVLMAGFETPTQLRFVYSYDITISSLTLKSGGAHEISLTYEWPREVKKRKYKAVPCPKF